jgi:hypothetical protein
MPLACGTLDVIISNTVLYDYCIRLLPSSLMKGTARLSVITTITKQ